jgi:hypothetical protein
MLEITPYKKSNFNVIFLINNLRDLLHSLELFVPNLIVKNYYSKFIDLSAREIFLKIILSINNSFNDEIKDLYKYILFENNIKLFKKLKETINYSKIISNYKYKEKLYKTLNEVYFLLQDLVAIWKVHKLILGNKFFKINDIFVKKEIDFVPIAGNKDIKSFYISKDCISNIQYTEFINMAGYSIYSYWSEEGINWLKSCNRTQPKYWKKINNKWYINDILLNEIKSHPIVNISYYEAEAFCNFIGGELPTKEEWEWVATNRNKTTYPWGINKPYIFETNANFINLGVVSNNILKCGNSLFGLSHLFGNNWEWTKNTEFKKHFVKGGCWILPDILLSKDLNWKIEPYKNIYEIGFRIVKKK